MPRVRRGDSEQVGFGSSTTSQGAILGPWLLHLGVWASFSPDGNCSLLVGPCEDEGVHCGRARLCRAGSPSVQFPQQPFPQAKAEGRACSELEVTREVDAQAVPPPS